MLDFIGLATWAISGFGSSWELVHVSVDTRLKKRKILQRLMGSKVKRRTWWTKFFASKRVKQSQSRALFTAQMETPVKIGTVPVQMHAIWVHQCQWAHCVLKAHNVTRDKSWITPTKSLHSTKHSFTNLCDHMFHCAQSVSKLLKKRHFGKYICSNKKTQNNKLTLQNIYVFFLKKGIHHLNRLRKTKIYFSSQAHLPP